MNRIREQHPRLIVVDYTTPNCVNGEQQLACAQGRRAACICEVGAFAAVLQCAAYDSHMQDVRPP